MKNVLADLCHRIGSRHGAGDAAGPGLRPADEGEARFRRIATAVAKYWVCKRHGRAVGEALECLGGNGFVEESIMPRLYRESPLNSIWEGSGNVICLDVLRAIGNEPASIDALLAEIDLGRGSRPAVGRLCSAKLRDEWKSLADDQRQARRLVERLALALEGSLVVRCSPPAVADAFCASRLTGDWGQAFGTFARKRRLRRDHRPRRAARRGLIAAAQACGLSIEGVSVMRIDAEPIARGGVRCDTAATWPRCARRSAATHFEAGALLRARTEANRAAVSFDQRLANRQAQAVAARARAVRLVGAEERSKT